LIRDKDIKSRYRKTEKDWKRERKLSFEQVLILILKGHKYPIQNSLNKFFEQMNDLKIVPTASAYCQARDKIKSKVFKEMSNKVVEDFYRLYDIKKWKSRRLIGIDGSKINFPNTADLRNRYKVMNSNFG